MKPRTTSLSKSLLINAVENGDLKEVQRLIDAKVNLDITDERVGHKGLTPLQIAFEIDRIDIAQVLLKNKAGVNARSEYGQTPLMVAAFNNGQTRLTPEASHKRVTHIKTLMAAKADVNLTDDYWETALHSVMRLKGRASDICPLYDALTGTLQASISENAKGLSPQQLNPSLWNNMQKEWAKKAKAPMSNHPKTTKSGAKFFVMPKKKDLSQAIARGDAVIVEKLIRLNPKELLSTCLSNGYTLLGEAVQQKQADVVKKLLELEADPHEPVKLLGENAFQLAKKAGNQYITKLLHDHAREAKMN